MIYIGIGLACGIAGFFAGLLFARKCISSVIEKYIDTHTDEEITILAETVFDLVGKDFYEEMEKEMK
ncbi:MAG: hypothetical protein HXS54_06120 [Theionarchaea archaeon]|nr:hypothetical protein [Theionarchaea archaeon]DBA34835.1 TPA_asm: hypothetical protein vir521_00041 [Caudoviricetes sp. vir521]